MDTNHPEISREIIKSKELSPATEKALKDAIAEFLKKVYTL